MQYADIIIDISHEHLDHTFQYRIPMHLEDRIEVGSVVDVPFGRGNNKKRGFVVSISKEPKLELDKIKDIDNICENAVNIESQLIRLAYWMKSHYGSTITRALRTVIPIKKKEAPKEKRIVHLLCSEDEARDFLEKLTSKKRYSISKKNMMEALLEEKSLPWDVLRDKLNIPANTLNDLVKNELVSVESVRDYRDPLKKLKRDDKKISLNEAQKHILDSFVADWEAGDRDTYLIYGVTGSGKTLCYIEMIDRVLKDGKQAIVLIPEIALTFQTLMRFYSRFGADVSVMHSRLSPGERYDQFERAKNGDIRIMIGPRSALFTPFNDLGLIIIDEEHEHTYKSEQVPKYHARETAIERARICGASVVLGSATPSLESFYRASLGEIKRFDLPSRATGSNMASCEIVDLRDELRSGNRSIISRRLKGLIDDRLEKNEQIMLFINRRGLMGFISCRACGSVIKCPHCDVSLSLHKDGKLHCHYCGHSKPSPNVCPECGSRYIGTFKAGTQKVEEVIRKEFPSARVLRMDADTTKGKEGHEKILSAFYNHEADILIGTQMIVKGHDFRDVTLVGILAADQSLNDNDFRSAERTFALLTQAAGRAGRGQKAGTVVIQTYRPDHYCVTTAANQDYDSFYEREIAFRKLLGYPPAGHMLLIQMTSSSEAYLNERAAVIDSWANEAIGLKAIMSSGPQDPGISRINDIYRKLIFIKCPDEAELIFIKDYIEKKSLEHKDTKVSVFFDLDPLNMF